MAQVRRRPFALLPERIRAIRPPKWWQELSFILIVYYLYSLVRNAAPSHETGAVHRAGSVLSVERTLHLDIEHSVNAVVAAHAWLANVCDYYYATLHFVVTIGVLVWLYVRHPLRYRSIRSVLIVTNLTALVGFWFVSLAPPRMLPGFTDTLIKFHTWGSIASGSIAKESNQYAAMPSLHVAWALWCGIAIVTLAERRWVRVLGALYPVCTVLVVLGTANHYVLDAVGGVLVLGFAIVVERLLSGRHAYSRAAFAAHLTPEPELAAA
ncbi:MAG TPA: phosphatase PAP2 family protein [Mycobacteriales bacterium]|nr:phosphatase PAP2 family protein [Mycobacteriales bacterium]